MMDGLIIPAKPQSIMIQNQNLSSWSLEIDEFELARSMDGKASI